MKTIFRISLALSLISFSSLISFGQFFPKIDKTIKDITKTVQSGTVAVASIGQLVNTTKRTQAEFDKMVVVDNSETPQPIVPPKEITKPKFKKGTFTNIDWEPVTYFDGQLFPSLIISMADYKGDVGTPSMKAIKSSALGFRFLSKESFIPIKWEIESSDKTFFDKIGGDYTFQQGGQERNFMPNIPWNMSALAKQSSSTPLNVIFRIFDAEGNKVEKSVPVFMRSVNDCIFRYKDLKMSFLFASYIQEQHPEIDRILRDALDTKTITAIKGYQRGSTTTEDELKKETINQVAAVWRVLHDRGFQYSSITTTSTEDTVIGSQQVRTFDNAIKSNQANCIDGTVVLASILRAMGIQSMIVTRPGHAYLAFYPSDQAGSLPVFLETTMLGSKLVIPPLPPIVPASKPAAKGAKVKKPLPPTAAEIAAQSNTAKNLAYREHFDRAMLSALMDFNKYASLNQVTIINVDDSRRAIRPLPF